MAKNIRGSLSANQTTALQGALQTLGYGNIKSDGVYGKQTQNAVNAAYKSLGLTPWTGGGISQYGYNKIIAAAANKRSTPIAQPKTQFAWTPNSTDYGGFSSIGKAEAFLTGGEYDPYGYTYDRSKWSGSQGLKAMMYGNNKDYKAKGMTQKDMSLINQYAAQYDALQRQRLLDAERMNQETNEAMANMQAQLQQFGDVEEMYRQSLGLQQQMYQQQKMQRESEIANTVNQIKGNENIINQSYEEAQKQAYIANMLEKNNLDDYLSMKGYTGGSSESIAQQLSTNYQENRNKASLERDEALRNNEKLVAEAQMSGNRDLANMASSATSDYLNALKEKAEMNFQMSQANRAQENANREFGFAKEQADRNFLLNQENLRREDERYVQKLRQDKAQADMQTFLNTYQGKYSKRATYEKWIKNLEKKKDPYGYNRQKIAYLKQYINQMYNSQGNVYSGGGTQRRYTRTGGGGGSRRQSPNIQSQTNNGLKKSQIKRYKNFLGEITLAGDAKNPYTIESYYSNKLNEIESAYKNKAITEKQAKRLIKEMQNNQKNATYGNMADRLEMRLNKQKH